MQLWVKVGTGQPFKLFLRIIAADVEDDDNDDDDDINKCLHKIASKFFTSWLCLGYLDQIGFCHLKSRNILAVLL